MEHIDGLLLQSTQWPPVPGVSAYDSPKEVDRK